MAWIFSYGTLINPEIRKKTGNSGKTCIARARGYRRRWNWQHPTQSRTALGVEKKEDCQCLGVVVEIPDSEIHKFDEREFNYRREHVDNVECQVKLDEVWIYVPIEPKLASTQKPIVQTYLDPILDYFLKVDEELAQEFLQTTMDWERPWVDDRDNPVYPRALEKVDTNRIDKCIKEFLHSNTQ